MGAALERAGIERLRRSSSAPTTSAAPGATTPIPGVGVDIPTFAYQFSYDLKPDWSRVFADGAEVKGYIDDYTAKHGLRLQDPLRQRGDRAHLGRGERTSGGWRSTAAARRSRPASSSARSAPSSTRSRPAIAGLDDFEGKLIHSARWDHDYDLAGKRVAIVGTGASAVQIIPAIAARGRAASTSTSARRSGSRRSSTRRSRERVKRLFARVPGRPAARLPRGQRDHRVGADLPRGQLQAAPVARPRGRAQQPALARARGPRPRAARAS